MSKAKSSDVVFFFGAGASAPFGIPTMKQFVVDFEEYLNENAEKSERLTYVDIKKTLEDRLHRQVDLEAVFTVIDGVINYDDPERLGMFSLYFATEFRKNFPNRIDVDICKRLRRKFQTFVKDKCVIPEESFGRIKLVYRDFFNRVALELGEFSTSGEDFAWNSNWSIFTTNYDTCLEYYWSDVANVPVDTGFEYDKVRKSSILRSRKFLSEGLGVIQLFKLHGSVTWLMEEKTDSIIELMEKGSSYLGRKYKGEMMLYPIAEKELYLDPYISMLLRLNRELERRPVWIVVGYSFGDPVVREIFLSKSTRGKHLVLVHPNAREVQNRRLGGIEGKVSLMEKRFGLSEDTVISGKEEESYKKVNHQIIHKLKEAPKFKWHDRVTP